MVQREYYCTNPNCGNFAFEYSGPCSNCGSEMTEEWEPLDQRVVVLDEKQSEFVLDLIAKTSSKHGGT